MIEATTDQEKISQALGWIVSLLKRHAIAYQISGGLAARAYGATRPLVDIDLCASLQESPQRQTFLEEIRPHLIREWGPYLSASWDIMYLALTYRGMQIEIGEGSAYRRIYNRRDGRWEERRLNFATPTHMNLYGVDVAVMPKDELLAYKAMLAREVDQLDIVQLTAAS